MQIKETTHTHFVTLAPAGELDANSSMQMDSAIQRLIDQGQYNIHLDCAGLRYISSAGLGVFISFMDELKANDGKFVFSGLSENILQVFKLLGLEQLMDIVDTEQEVAERFTT